MRLCISSSEPMIAASKLLKSWAIPPVNWPIASIFWLGNNVEGAACPRSTKPIDFVGHRLARTQRHSSIPIDAFSAFFSIDVRRSATDDVFTRKAIQTRAGRIDVFKNQPVVRCQSQQV